MEHNKITEGQNKKQDVVEPEGEHSVKKRKSLFPVKRFSDSHLQGVSEDIIDMELTLFKAEARIIRGIIDVDPARWCTVWQKGDYGVIGIHVNGTHKCCIGTDSKSTT